MKNIFKTALVATAIATACGSAQAGNIAVTKQVYSQEGVGAVSSVQTSAAISYTLKASYQEGDKITLTFSDGAIPSDVTGSGLPTTIEVDATPGSSGHAGLTLGLLNNTANSVTYRVTNLAPNDVDVGSTVNAVVDFGSVRLAADAVASAGTTVTVSSATAVGDVLDSNGTTTGTLTEIKSQFGSVQAFAESDQFDATIDVGEGRLDFTSATENPEMTFTISEVNTTGWEQVATVNSTKVTLTVDGLDGLEASDFSAAVTGVINNDETAIVFTYSGEVTTDTISFEAPGDVVLEAQEFELSAEVTYATTETADLSSAVAGEWELNGAMVNIPYMPYGSTISQIIYVTNESGLAADVSVTAFDQDGNTYDLDVVASAGSKSVTRLAPAINDALELAGLDLETRQNLSMTITVNAEDEDITVYAAYNVGGSDRGTVLTDQYKKEKED